MTKGERTRQRIVASAAPVFNVYGFSGASMSTLTEVAGIEKGGIYNHFPSKEALALAAFDYSVELIGRRFEAAMAPHEMVIDQLMALAQIFELEFENQLVPGGCPVFNTAIEADDTSPALRQRAQEAMTLWQKMIGRRIKDGIASGELRQDSDPRSVATVMTSLLEGALALSRLYGDEIYLKRAIGHLRTYLAGLRTP